MSRLGLLLLVAAVAAIAAARADAAAPRYILVTGPGLSRPVLLGDWEENLRLLGALVNGSPAGARTRAARPRYDLALFWGVPAKPVPTRPRDANQHGWFSPAIGSRPAVAALVLGGVRTLRVVPPAALRILARHGVPTRA